MKHHYTQPAQHYSSKAGSTVTVLLAVIKYDSLVCGGLSKRDYTLCRLYLEIHPNFCLASCTEIREYTT